MPRDTVADFYEMLDLTVLEPERRAAHGLDPIEPEPGCRYNPDADRACGTHFRAWSGGLTPQPLLRWTDEIVCLGAAEDALDDILDHVRDLWDEARGKRAKAKGKKRARLDAKVRTIGEHVTVLEVLRDTLHWSVTD